MNTLESKLAGVCTKIDRYHIREGERQRERLMKEIRSGNPSEAVKILNDTPRPIDR